MRGRPCGRECVPRRRVAPEVGGWNPEDFAREQIRGLVRQVFFSNVERPVRQVVFSALDPETDVKSICRQVGEALALETAGGVAVVGKYPQVLRDPDTLSVKEPGWKHVAAPDGDSASRQSVAGASGRKGWRTAKHRFVARISGRYVRRV